MSKVDSAVVGQQLTTPTVPPSPAAASRPADEFMRRLLRVSAQDRSSIAGAHRAFRLSLLFTALRCTITYVLVPVLVPLIAFAGVFAAPFTITLTLLAMINGVVSLQRFWRAGHRAKWTYTWFMAVVFTVLTVALALEIAAYWG